MDSYLEKYTELSYSHQYCGVDPISFTSQNEKAEGTEGIIFTNLIELKAVGVADLTIQTKDSIGGAYAVCKVVVHSASPATTTKKLKTIGEEAFADAAFEEIILTDGVISIGSRAFKNCTELKMITIPSSVVSIEPDAFSGCVDFIILCAADSFAYKYALNNGISYFVI